MGALTLKPFSDESREWELFEFESIDITDGFGSYLRLSVKENIIISAEPYDPSIPWLTDRGRLFFEGSVYQKESEVESNVWETAFKKLQAAAYFADHLSFSEQSLRVPGNITVVFRQIDIESCCFLTWLDGKLPFLKIRKDEPFFKNIDSEQSYLVTPSLELPRLKFSSLAVLLGINTRYESYHLNLLFRQRFLKGGFQLVQVGSDIDLTIPTEASGWSMSFFKNVAEGVSPLCRTLSGSVLPVFVSSYRFYKSPYFSVFDSMVSVMSSACSSLGTLSTVSDKIEAAGINNLNKFKHLTPSELDSASSVYYLNVDLKENLGVKKVFDKLSLNFSGVSVSEPKLLLEHSTECSEIEYNVFKGLSEIFYMQMPVKSFFEQNNRYLSARGATLISVKILGSCQNRKSDWSAVRQIGTVLNRLKLFSDKKSSFLLDKTLTVSYRQKHYNAFTAYPIKSLTTVCSNPGASANTSNSFFHQPFPTNYRTLGIVFKNTVIKPWLDDFFVGGLKDVYSTKSSTLVKCSNLSRVSNTNFF